MIRSAILSIFLCSLPAGALAGPQAEKPAAAEPPELKQAAQAMRDRLPEVAMAKLQRLLDQPKLDKEVHRTASLRLAEAAVRSGKPQRALDALPDPATPEERFWKASALQSLGRLAEAELLLREWPADGSWPLSSEAAFNRAAIAVAMNDPAAAAAVLEPLAQSPVSQTAQRAALWMVEIRWQQGNTTAVEKGLAELEKMPLAPALSAQLQYLKARMALAEGQPAEAEKIYSTLLASKNPGRELLQASTIGLARAQRVGGDKAAAARTLGTFVTSSPESPLLDDAFAEIILCNTPPVAELNKFLESWVTETSPVVSTHARAALIAASEAAGQLDVAVQRCKDFTMRHPDSPLLSRIVLQEARILIRQEKLPDALALLKEFKEKAPPEFRALAAELEGYAHLRSKDFSKAALVFQEAAGMAAEPEKKLLAAYNAALASLQAGQPAEAVAIIDGLPAASEKLRGDLLLERGLYAAARGNSEADNLLAAFLDGHPSHPRAFEAAVARTEIALAAAEFDPAGVREKLRSAATLAKSPAEQERLTVLELHVDALTVDPDSFAKKLASFLEQHPESPWKDELLMRCGEALFNDQQYGSAKASFLKIADEVPDSPLTDTALFWAGKAALGSMAKGCESEALKLWDRVAIGDSPLRVKARMEQAKLNQRRDPTAALQIFDAILKDDPPPDMETRFAVLCLKGETLLARDTGRPDQAKSALDCFDAVVATPGVPADWKQQALVRKGIALEQLKQPNPALEAYYEAMNLYSPGNAAPGGDLFWFFRAGEKAIRLIESMPKPDWPAAVSIANKLGEAPGPQGAAAREKASRLATEHFIYDAE